MSSIWDNIVKKTGSGGVGDVSVDQKNQTISDAVARKF